MLHASDLTLKYLSKSPFNINRRIILIMLLCCWHILQKESPLSVVIMVSSLL